jgi:hypothetical protein
MRIMLTVAAFAVFAVTTGLLEMAKTRHRPVTVLPPAMSTFSPAPVDATVTSSITPHRLDER